MQIPTHPITFPEVRRSNAKQEKRLSRHCVVVDALRRMGSHGKRKPNFFLQKDAMIAISNSISRDTKMHSYYSGVSTDRGGAGGRPTWRGAKLPYGFGAIPMPGMPENWGGGGAGLYGVPAGPELFCERPQERRTREFPMG